MWLIILCCCLILYFFKTKPSVDNFDPLAHYKQLLIPTTTREQRYLSFLNNLNTTFKSKMPQTGPFRGTCNDKINQEIQKQSLKEVFHNQLTDNKHLGIQDDFKRDPCIAVSSHLCQFTDPMMYLTESQMPPRWLMKSLKDQPLPAHVDMPCFNRTYNCCKNSYQSKKQLMNL